MICFPVFDIKGLFYSTWKISDCGLGYWSGECRSVDVLPCLPHPLCDISHAYVLPIYVIIPGSPPPPTCPLSKVELIKRFTSRVSSYGCHMWCKIESERLLGLLSEYEHLRRGIFFLNALPEKNGTGFNLLEDLVPLVYIY